MHGQNLVVSLLLNFIKNSLILRLCITNYPFVHRKAIKGAFSSFIYNKEVAKIIPYILDEIGVINIGGKKKIFMNLQKFQ